MASSLPQKLTVFLPVVATGVLIANWLAIYQHTATAITLVMLPFAKLAQASWFGAGLAGSVTQGISWIGMQCIMHPYLTHLLLAALLLPPAINLLGELLTGRKKLIPTFFDLFDASQQPRHALASDAQNNEPQNTPDAGFSQPNTQTQTLEKTPEPRDFTIPEYQPTAQDLAETPGSRLPK